MYLYKQKKMSVSQIPKKNDIIINPTTQRPVRVGGRAWLKLVKDGLVSGHYSDPKNLETIGDDPEEQIKELNKKLPKGVQAVRGRGKYKGKITTRNMTPKVEDISKYTAEIASKIVNENMETLADSEDIEAELEKLILQEMMESKILKNKKESKKNKKNEPKTKYTLEELEEDIEEKEEEEEEEEEINYFNDVEEEEEEEEEINYL